MMSCYQNFPEYAFWNLLEIYALVHQGKLFIGGCLSRGTLLQNPPKAGPRKTADAMAFRSLTPEKFPVLQESEMEKLYTLQELYAGEVLGAIGTRAQRSCVHCRRWMLGDL